MADIPLKQHILSQIWQNSPDNMFLMRPGNDDFYMIDANLAERTSFELISSLANGTPLRNLLPAELYDQVTANYRHCMELRESISYEEAETIQRKIKENKNTFSWQWLKSGRSEKWIELYLEQINPGVKK